MSAALPLVAASRPVSVPPSPLDALERARSFLRSLQHEPGHWHGELETNVTMDAEDLLLRQFLGVRTPTQTEETARFIRGQQRADGTWSNAPGAPGDLSTTVEAYVALRLAGDAGDAPHMRRAATFIRENGGLRATRVFTRIWLALFGQHPWDELPVLPPELMLLPPWVPLNVYDFACWARQTIVALSVVMTYRPVRPLGVTLEELEVEDPPRRSHEPRVARRLARRLFSGVDALLRTYARRPITPLREAALAEAERWIVRRQEADGSWGGIQPPWVYSLMALSLRGYPLEHPVLRAGLEGLDTFTVRESDAPAPDGSRSSEGGTRRLEACQSPVWDTALAIQALVEAGTSRDDPALLRAVDWLLDHEVRVRGDWAVRRPALRPSGWAFEHANVNYPDVDDTAEVMLALRAVRHPRVNEIESALARGLTWTLGMQSRGGGWGAFDADNTRALCRLIPFCDFGEVIDTPSADVTAHAIEMLVREGLVEHPKTQAATRWLLDHQEPDGSWFGRWGVNYVYGTGAVMVALRDAGLAPDHDALTRARAWLEAHQNDDGGWGEDVRSYDDPAWRGRGSSTPSQTAWALMGLLAVGAPDGSTTGAIERGLAHLVGTQRADGGWDEACFTGTGFPGDFYIGYHLYRQVFPMMAIGRYARRTGQLVEPAPSVTPHVLLERVTRTVRA